MSQKVKKALLILINCLLTFFLIIMQYTPLLSFSLFGGTPLLPLAILIAISMFCTELTASMIGMVIGTFVDSSASTGFGFNSITFFLVGFLTSFLIHFLFNNNFRSAITLGVILSTLYFTLRWLFFYVGGHTMNDSFIYLFRYALPSMLLTALATLIFFFLEKLLFKKLN